MNRLFCILSIICLQIAGAATTFIFAGDSTMADYSIARQPLCGWGQAFKAFLHQGSNLKNFAQSGASSKSFQATGQWEKLLAAVEEGNVVVIQFGHNDAAADLAKHTDPKSGFQENLRHFVQTVRARKGIPVLCTPVAYRVFNSDGSLKNLHGDYPETVRQVAEKEKVPCLDLTAISTEIYLRYGTEKSKALFKYCQPGEYPAFPEGASDDCHFNSDGAREIALAVVREFHRRKLPGSENLQLPKWHSDFANAKDKKLPAPWGVWAKDGQGETAVQSGPHGSALQVTKANSLALQYDIPVKAGEKFYVQADYDQTGGGKTSFSIAWKGTHRKWLSLQRIKGKHQVTGDSLRKISARVTVPEGVEYLCALFGVEDQSHPEDCVRLYQLSIQQHFENSAEFPAHEPAPHFGLSAGVQDYPTYQNHVEVLKTLRMEVIKHSEVIGDEGNQWIVPATAAKAAKETRAAGFNCIITEGQRFLMRDLDQFTGPLDVIKGSLKFPDLLQNTKTIVDAFHAEGLRVYLHLTSGLAPHEFYQVHPSWMIKSVVDNGERRYWGLNWICQNNVAYCREYEKRLEELVRVARPDGLMVDETTNMYDSCGCPDCRRLFTEDTGLILPEAGDSEWFNNLESPIYRKFLQWRIACARKKNDRYRAILKKHIPDGVLLSYYAVPYNEKSWYEHGMSLEFCAETGEIFGLETISNYRKYWAMFIANMKLTRYVAEKKHGTAFTITAFPDFDVLYACWLLNLSQGGHQYWSWYQNQTIKERRKELIQWEMKHEKLFAGLQSAGEVAVLFSSRDLNLRRHPRGRIHRQNLYLAAANNLTLAQIPYRAVGDLDLEKPISDSIKTLIALDAGLLTEKAVSHIRDFVAAGGRLITSSEFSLYDSDGEQRENFALADVLGCDYISLLDGEARLQEIGGISCPADALVKTKLRSNARAAALFSDHAAPGLVHHRFGKGESWYFAGSIAPAIYFNEFNGTAIIDRDFNDPRKQEIARFFCDLAAGDSQALKTNRLPAGVVIEKYLQENVPQMNILNFTGMMSEGHPETSHFNFPEIRNASITIPNLKCSKVRVFSPEFSDSKDLPFARQNGMLTFQLPPFKNLLIVRFE